MQNTLFSANDNNLKCYFCKTVSKEIIGPTIQTPYTSTNYLYVVCRDCYFKYHCIYCKDFTLKEKCPGHSVKVKEGNRFVEDKKLMKELTFDVTG